MNNETIKVGDKVKIIKDDWNYVGVTGIVMNANPVENSTQCIVNINGFNMIVSRNEIEKYKSSRES
ncbi:hypothetical protein UFOVP787_5 [uncultured Caudovirales phage]|uniref:Uncharacterized protein n=1 Tax=uncultured Caudovirales phage TaxID=2100421 RepID=A0A6J5NSK8_9CAUD|nr:hypothetical protein UFOVP787_5 [uncultured Caudovirales phage]